MKKPSNSLYSSRDISNLPESNGRRSKSRGWWGIYRFMGRDVFGRMVFQSNFCGKPISTFTFETDDDFWGTGR